LVRKSFVELNARERAQALLDEGGYRELLGPFERLESPWLLLQGVVRKRTMIDRCSRPDGRNRLRDLSYRRTISGWRYRLKFLAPRLPRALDLALERLQKRFILYKSFYFWKTAGVRLQEANLGLEAIAEINSSLIALRQHVPVVGVIANDRLLWRHVHQRLALQLSDHDSRARLGLNGPEVIEEQSGIEEFDSKDRQLILEREWWRTTPGYRFADYLAEDDVEANQKNASSKLLPAAFLPRIAPKKWIDYLKRLAAVDASHQTGEQ